VPDGMVLFSMTLSDPYNPGFKVTVYLQVEYLKKGQSYFRTLIRNHTQSIE